MMALPPTLRWVAALGFFIGALAGCSTVPARDFAAYKDAFAQARAAGEEVLLDHAAAREQFDRLKATVDEAKLREEADRRGISVEELRAEQEEAEALAFSVASITAAERVEDDIGIRMRGWQVVHDYNEVLTKLAEGRPASEVESALDGLLQGLESLPIDAVQSAIKTVAPFVPDLKQVLALVRRELEARQFRKAVEAASPLIQGYLALLRKDAADFYDVRFGLYRSEHTAHRQTALKLQQAMAPLLSSLADGAPTLPTDSREEDERLVKEVNSALLKFPKWNRRNLLSAPERTAGKHRPAAAHSQLQQLELEIKAVVAEAQASRARLLAYQGVVTNYVRLVDELGRRVDALARAAQEGPRRAPPFADVLRLAVNVRRSIAAYQNAKAD